MAIRSSWGGLWRGQLRRISGRRPVLPCDEPDPERAPAGDVYDWYVRGRDLLSSGDAAAAVQMLSRTVEAEPRARSAREMLARAQFDAGQYPGSQRRLSRTSSRAIRLITTRTSASALSLASSAIWPRRWSIWLSPSAMRPDLERYARELAIGPGRLGAPMTPSSERPKAARPLQASRLALDQAFDVALLDLDGVVYRGHDPVPHAAQALARVRRSGMRLSFVTNNALRPPDEVARRIAAAGVEADAKDVATSAQAAARLLAEQLPSGRQGPGGRRRGTATGRSESAVWCR